MAAFINVVGTPATPQFAEFLVRGEVTLSAGVRSIIQVWHLKQRPPFVLTPPLTLGGAAMFAMSAALSAALSNDYTAIDYRIRYMDDPTAADTAGTNTIVGAVTGDRLPSFNSAVIQLRGGARGRNFRGSKHFAPVAESHTTEDKLNAGAIVLWTAVATALYDLQGLAPGDGSQWDPIVLSTTLSDLSVNPSIFTGNVFDEFILNNIVGTMKRRKEKAGT